MTAASAGGATQESVDSIRFNAPRFNATKNRAITTNDYQALILSANPNVKSVAVWGGEDNDPPIYGKVFISLQPKDGIIISQDDKDNLNRETIQPRQPVSIQAEFVDPEFTYLGLTATVSYDPKKTTASEGTLKGLVDTEIESYLDTELNALDKNFYYSILTSRIVALSNSFIAVNLELKLTKRNKVTTGSAIKYEMQFNNKLQPRSVTSNFFTATINSADYKVYIQDVPNDDVVAPNYNGKGKLILKTADKNVTVDANAGSIDYDTGLVDITLNVKSISGSSVTDLRITAQPHESAKDIKTEVLTRQSDRLNTESGAVVALPSKNIIITKDTTSNDIPNNIRAGLTVNLTAKTSD